MEKIAVFIAIMLGVDLVWELYEIYTYGHTIQSNPTQLVEYILLSMLITMLITNS